MQQSAQLQQQQHNHRGWMHRSSCVTTSASGRAALGVKLQQQRRLVAALAARQHVTVAMAAQHPQPAGFASSSSTVGGAGTKFAVAIIGDLHLEPGQMHLFHEAREQLTAAMAAGDGDAVPRVVQLGDLGGYSHRPGSRDCFRVAAEYLRGFGVPVALITGNHDLEGDEFQDDAANLAAWQEAFQQHHHWAVPLGRVLAVGLSTVRFRSNAHSVHEVYIDDEQVAWFESVLAAHPDTPVVVFSHAPPMGSGLKVVQHVHVKNRCAWLNHSDRPQRFVQLVERHPQVKLWCSAHYHLSQNYLDSCAVVGSCAFVQVGVIGQCNRDGFRQSRLLRFDDQGYELLTVDHGAGGRLRLDLKHTWGAPAGPARITPEHEIVAEPGAGALCSQLDCRLPDAAGDGGDAAAAPRTQWLAAGPNCLLAVQDGLVVEYDMAMRAPIGVVAFLEPGQTVSLVDASGAALAGDGDGCNAAALLVRDGVTGETQQLERNDQGTFYRVFQANKWRAKKAADAAAAVAAAAAEEAASTSVAVGAGTR